MSNVLQGKIAIVIGAISGNDKGTSLKLVKSGVKTEGSES